jgi:toxin ParE1/3/4
MMKKLVRRSRADADVLAALDYYITNAPEYVFGFIDDLELAYQHIQQFPASGSPRYAHELDLPELRAWKCHKFPYVVFYAENAKCIEVWRVL